MTELIVLLFHPSNALSISDTAKYIVGFFPSALHYFSWREDVAASSYFRRRGALVVGSLGDQK